MYIPEVYWHIVFRGLLGSADGLPLLERGIFINYPGTGWGLLRIESPPQFWCIMACAESVMGLENSSYNWCYAQFGELSINLITFLLQLLFNHICFLLPEKCSSSLLPWRQASPKWLPLIQEQMQLEFKQLGKECICLYRGCKVECDIQNYLKHVTI